MYRDVSQLAWCGGGCFDSRRRVNSDVGCPRAAQDTEPRDRARREVLNMMIAVAGPYSAPTAVQRQQNLDAMNRAAAELMRRGHIPVIGVNAALPVVEMLDSDDRYEAIMAISLAVVGRCDAILIIGDSPGVERERNLLVAQGRPVYLSLTDVPEAPDPQ